jgi:DNA-damage-inducible protein J
MAQASVNIRMDSEVKRQADSLFLSLGLNMSVAVNMFVRQALMQRRIPFDVAESAEAVQDDRKAVRKAPQYGCLSGKIRMADDFDALIDDFKDYM